MARSKRKGPYVVLKILKKIEKAGPGETVQVWCRSMTITPKLVGKTVLVHAGNKWIPVYITVDMIDKKLGEFAETRKHTQHAGDRKANR